MKLTKAVIYFAMACISLMAIFSSYASAKGSDLPQDLLYKGIPLNRSCIETLAFGDRMGPVDELDLSQCSQNAAFVEEGELTWSYKGTLSNGLHVLYVYLWPGAMGKYTEILFVQRKGDHLKVTGTIGGGDRHSTMIFEQSITVNNNIVSYEHGEAYGTFSELPYEVEDFNIGSCIGEACYMGSSRWEVTFHPDGNVEKKFISFSLASSFDPKEKENSCKEILSDTARKDLSNLQALQTLFMQAECKGITKFNATELKEMVLKAKSMADPNKENVY